MFQYFAHFVSFCFLKILSKCHEFLNEYQACLNARWFQIIVTKFQNVYIFKRFFLRFDLSAYISSVLIFVSDNEAPEISACPNDLTQHTDPGLSTALVTWTDHTAVDNVDPNPVVSCTPVSGSEFAVGITEVVCKATDANENQAKCRFTVLVTGKHPFSKHFLWTRVCSH